jgi:p-hydroxybenzoate 3-monooxygenase
MQTQIGIVGAGPAGLVLSHLLHLEGIESVILEQRSRSYIEQRVRAGVLEQETVNLLTATGVGERLAREGLVHHGILLSTRGRRHRVALTDLTGRAITIYGQQEVVKDLVAARLAAGATLHFEVEDVRFEGLDTTRPLIRYRGAGGGEHELRCDFVAGCDGYHGVSRGAIPAGVLTAHHREYPFAWLGILAAVAPSTDELIYARHPRGFALHSLRSPDVSRLYIQVDPGERLEDWSDDRIWDELRLRLAGDGFHLADGPVLEKSIAIHRSFVVEPMQHGRLFLAGDAAHIVPPTGAKGLNLAVADVRALAQGIVRWYRSGDGEGLDRYSERCLARVWRVQEFSSWMSLLLHRIPGADTFQERLSEAALAWIFRSEAAARSLAENYVGLPFGD